MDQTPVKRTQAERREQTQQKILASACALFGEQGFSNTALEDIARDAGITEGPIYHYYGNKKKLFTLVTELMEAGLTEKLAALDLTQTDSSILQAWDSFVEICRQPGFVQIVLIDAPHVLGRERWQQTSVINQVVTLLEQGGLLSDDSFSEADRSLMIRMLTSAMAEVALTIAEQPDYDAGAVLGKIAALFSS